MEEEKIQIAELDNNDNAHHMMRGQKYIPDFWREKYICEYAKKWNIFYKRNMNRFFKDRHWTEKEFPDLQNLDGKILFEVGCGVGNFFVPLLKEGVSIIGCDISECAIDFLNEAKNYPNCKFVTFDITNEFKFMEEETVDIASLIFVLSAIPPHLMKQVFHNIAKVLKPNAILLFRDYGRHDFAQRRFKEKMDENFYVRDDGTFAYYFTVDQVKEMATDFFHVDECRFVYKRTRNIKLGLDVQRIFIQGTFRKK